MEHTHIDSTILHGFRSLQVYFRSIHHSGAMVNWLAPQFEAMRGKVDVSSYADVTPAWMVKCMEPHIEPYMRNIPVATFMGLQSCDYSGYIEQYPELGALDMSSISATDFITSMPPGMMMKILQAQREQRNSATRH